jgi:hypothetical protein
MEVSKSLLTQIKNLCTYNNLSFDLIDWHVEIDRTLKDSENITLIKEKFHLKSPSDLSEHPDEAEQINKYKSWRSNQQEGLNIFQYDNPLSIVVFGDRGSGKTALSHCINDKIRQVKNRPVYVFKHPRPDLMTNIGYKNISALSDIKKLQNCVLWLDEPQLSLPKIEARNNETLAQILSIGRHSNIILVITTSDSRWVNKHLESYIDLWIIKDTDYTMIKNGSKIRNIIKEYENFSPESFELQKNEYLLYMRKNKEFQGKYTFQLPKYYSQEYSKTYKKND